ncbi:hypothetical protein HZC07_06305 [Candidatus Micrarchaeota archaeon]|nr:hypothetical protein [Candidatus Micrarchaeota archaeon]
MAILSTQVQDAAKRSKFHRAIVQWDVFCNVPGRLHSLAFGYGSHGEDVDINVVVPPPITHFKAFAVMTDPNSGLRDRLPPSDRTIERLLPYHSTAGQLASLRLAQLHQAASERGYALCQLSPLVVSGPLGGFSMFSITIPVSHGMGTIDWVVPSSAPVIFGLIANEGEHAGLISPVVVSSDFVLVCGPTALFGPSYDFQTGSPSFLTLIGDRPLKLE